MIDLVSMQHIPSLRISITVGRFVPKRCPRRPDLLPVIKAPSLFPGIQPPAAIGSTFAARTVSTLN